MFVCSSILASGSLEDTANAIYNKGYAASEHQVVLPSEWVRLLNGRVMIHFPYLAYIFDRYAKHKDGSEAAIWKERLRFLGISYIDTNDSSSKDNIIHSFISFQ